MIHLEPWHRYGLNLSKDKEALLEMLERGLIDPQDFAQRWKRLQVDNHAGWLKPDARGDGLIMTGHWLAAHAPAVEELHLRLRELPVVLDGNLLPFFPRVEERMQVTRLRRTVSGLAAMMASGARLYIYLDSGSATAIFTEAEFDAFFNRTLEEAREWARRIHVAQQEANRANEPQVNEIMDLLGMGRGRRE